MNPDHVETSLDSKPPMKLVFPGYHIGQQIYASASSLIYRAIREQDQRPVVLKILNPDYPHPEELVRYKQEYEITSHLNTAGVITAYGLEWFRDTLVLILEDFGGGSLDHWLKVWIRTGSATFPLPQFLRLARQIVEGLAQLHAVGIIHKNIIPANIVFNPDTGDLKLIDFGLATTLSRETPTLKSPHVLEGTLAYLSPEQTGRMNRTMDYRTDFYSLGVTFYELLTGQLPFESADAMELVHFHLAKTPLAPHLLNPTVPVVVSDIVMKLMSKAPEDRYQSTHGLQHDLDVCERHWQAHADIPDFKLGQQDRAERLLIPEKLYGRSAEIETLLAAFERVAGGHIELMLVAGFSGIGKTAVINEIHKPIVRQRGYFIRGKFDQFNRSIPFSGFVQAFRDLMEQLLSESPDQRQQWRSEILSALGENGQVVIEMIPELERLIGPQPPVPELSGNAVQNRFNLLLPKFIEVFTTQEHPLAIFLDDLQWADLASLKLLQLLISEARTGYLLLVGAYRDNEVPPAHPLQLTLDEIEKTGVTLNIITLAPLRQADINRLVADTLKCRPKLALPLAKLVYQKAKGNPFFSRQFLKALYEEGLITFSVKAGHWQCDLARVNTLALSDDVIELMAIQLKKLPAKTQEVIKSAACIGNQFDLETLAIVCQQSPVKTAADLWPALKEGLVLPQSEVPKFVRESERDPDIIPSADANVQIPVYKFLHDRVQQAAYSLIPETQRPTLHLNIGRLLLNKTPEPQQGKRLFELTSQLNAGLSQITDPAERYTLAHLNLQAGQKAKAATAHTVAMDYLTVGLSLLPPACWQTHYPLTLSLYHELVEVAYLTGNFEQMEQWAEMVLQHADTLLDKVKVYEVLIYANIARNQPKAAVQLGLSVLDELGVPFPENRDQSEIKSAFQHVPMALGGKPISELLHLPLMTDPVLLAAMRIMYSIGAPAYWVDPLLNSLLTIRSLLLSINYGNTAVSIHAYASYGMYLCAVLGDIESGYEFGQLALNLLPYLNAKEVQSRACFTFYIFVHHWKSAIAETLAPLLESYHIGLETGDLNFACGAVSMRSTNAYFIGHELNGLAKEIAVFQAAIHRFHQEYHAYYLGTCQQAVLNLLGESSDPCALVGEAYDETRMLPLYEQVSDTTALHNLFIHKIILCYMFGEFEQAVEHASRSEQYLAGVPGMVAGVLHYFYDSLARLSIYDRSDPDTQNAILQKVRQNQEKFQRWAASAPMNYQPKFELVEAERCRILGEPLAAMDWYDCAINDAKENGYIQEEALANELAARFYLGWDKDKIAQIYLQEAYCGYRQWGAAAKTAHLERLYPRLLAPVLDSPRRQSGLTNSSVGAPLDLITVIKASQAITGEIELGRLLKQMVRIVLENAGAQHGALILERAGDWLIEAEGDVNGEITVLQSLDLRQSAVVPAGIVYYVAHTCASVVLDDATNAGEFTHDPAIARRGVKSVICAPLINQGRLSGIVYLENNLTTYAFTAERLELLNLLSTQMALSLDNAQLYQQAQQEIAERKLAEAAAQESERRFRTIFDSVNDAIFVHDIDTGEILDVNRTMCAMYGYTHEEALRLELGDLGSGEPPYTQQGAMAWIKKVSEGEPRVFEWRARDKSGRLFWSEVNTRRATINGRDRLLVTARDITDRKRVEEALRESEQSTREFLEKLRALHEIGLELSAIQTLDTFYYQAVLAAKRLGIERCGLFLIDDDQNLAGTYGTDESGGIRDERFLKIRLTEESRELQLVKEGVSVYHWDEVDLRGAEQVVGRGWSILAVLWSGSKAIGLIAADSYLTHQPPRPYTVDLMGLYANVVGNLLTQKRAEMEIRKLNEELEQRVIARTQELQEANEEIRQFVYIVSHDLRAPLVNLKGFASELRSSLSAVIDGSEEFLPLVDPLKRDKMQCALLEDIPEALRFIESSVSSMDTLTRAILKLSRLGRLPLELVEVDVRSLVEKILQAHAYDISQRGITVIIGNLPVVDADFVSMEQIFGNILTNAVAYLDPNRPGEIEISAELKADETTFRIRDNGRGIAEEDMDKVFAPFRRAGKQDVPGEGMGLAYVQALVRRHSGSIWCESEAGVGTTFVFILPRNLKSDT